MRGNPMGDVSFNPPLINDEPLPLPQPDTIAKGDQVLGLMSAGWTNEKHSTYITSMEASFVDQLYGLQNHVPDANKSHFGNNGFKGIQEGLYKKVSIERTNARLQDGSQPENTWVRRFRPRNAGVNRRGDGREASVDDYGSGTDSVRKKVQNYGREVKTCSDENIIGKSKEVSDQNFPEEDVDADDEPCKKKRPTSPSSDPNDQPTLFHLEKLRAVTNAGKIEAVLKPEGSIGSLILGSFCVTWMRCCHCYWSLDLAN
ncbi:hypothetical protein EJB05_22539 [Eragrostis curvula]|uniref:Uncharacterized protein n=1 Tax=Eragrostis curvula TaxID=38414 RepID=A0A5J9V453_9POAL|nr:hypothetical protein EJB05_22539 [Eragrostis curvula]